MEIREERARRNYDQPRNSVQQQTVLARPKPLTMNNYYFDEIVPEHVFWVDISDSDYAGIPSLMQNGFCELCQTTYHDARTHRGEGDHQANMKKWCKRQGDRLSLVKKHLKHAARRKGDIQRLGLPGWRTDIRKRLQLPTYDKLLAKSSGNGSFSDPALPNGTKRLQSYMLRERMVLLELALWKAAIFTEYCGPSDVISFLEFQRQGLKDCKRQYRSHKSVDLIVCLVLPFVSESPKKPNHNEAQD